MGLRKGVDLKHLEHHGFCPRGWQRQNGDDLLKFSDVWELGMISTTSLTEPAQRALVHSCLWTAVFAYWPTISSKDM